MSEAFMKIFSFLLPEFDVDTDKEGEFDDDDDEDNDEHPFNQLSS